MDNKNTKDKTKSDIRQLARHFIDPDLQLEGILCESFDDFYLLEKRSQSKLLTFLYAALVRGYLLLCKISTLYNDFKP